MKTLVPLLSLSLAAVACGGGATSQTPASRANPAIDQRKMNGAADDGSRCDFKGRADREVVESTGPGAMMPNVRRVFGVLGEGDDRRRVLFCREIDTNLDGAKDVVRTYNDKGDAVDEQADSNYDGKVDTWIRFSGGRISKVELDDNGDGRPDETRYYVKGKLSRVQRDTNHDGKADVWEVYADGQLERMGVDLDFDGHVDRWDRDEIAHRIAEEKERAEEQKAADAQKGAADAEKADAPKSDATKTDTAKPAGDTKTPDAAPKK
ncbi:MAG TPA: hypothetical protein VHE30_26370 [Polyangiaceae bacterium]|nr:hypothetical protein [Polyangiaceae bacterium]